MPPASKLRGYSWKTGAILALRLAPWVVFGPITGFFTERAASAFLKGRPGTAVLMVVLNVVIVASIPTMTVAVLALQGDPAAAAADHAQPLTPPRLKNG
jgi:hypothetical protein